MLGHVSYVETSHARRVAECFSAEYRDWRNTRELSLRPSREAQVSCRTDNSNRLSTDPLSGMTQLN